MKWTFNSRICSCRALQIQNCWISSLNSNNKFINLDYAIVLQPKCIVEMTVTITIHLFQEVYTSHGYFGRFWEIATYISVMVNPHYIHFYKNKYNKLTPLLLIHLFRQPMQAWGLYICYNRGLYICYLSLMN